MIRRYQRFNNQHELTIGQGPSIPPPVLAQTVVQDIDQEEVIRKHAKARLAVHEGIDTSFVLWEGGRTPLRFPAGANPSVAILSYTVPPGRVLVIDQVDYWLSEPFCYGSGQFVWQLNISRAQLPFHKGSVAVNGRDSLWVPLDNISGDSKIHPVYVQSSELVEVVIFETSLVSAFNEYLTAQAGISGKLVKPTGGIY